MKTYNSTLCYIERNHQYLMLHRVKKEQDINAGKWIGVGGKFEECESPEECLLREVREETGLTLTSYKLRGIVTFVTPVETEYMFLYTADGFLGAGDQVDGTGKEVADDKNESATLSARDVFHGQFNCDEGDLKWIDIDKIETLSLWEGDRIFLRLLREEAPFFSLKLVYNETGVLQKAVLDGNDVSP